MLGIHLHTNRSVSCRANCCWNTSAAIININALCVWRARVCVHTMFDGKTFQWQSHIKIHPQARRCLISRNTLFCFLLLRAGALPLDEFPGAEACLVYNWSSQVLHWEDQVSMKNQALHLYLVNLSVVSGWISSNYMSWGNRWMRQAPSVEKHVIGVHSCSGIPVGPLWLHCLSQAVFVCVPVTKGVCVRARVCLCAFLSVYESMFPTKFGEHKPAVAAASCLELKSGLREGSEFLKQVWAHLVVIGRRKKSSYVLGTGSKSLTQPSITQPSTVQNQPTQGRGAGGKYTPTAGLLPFTLPTYPSSWPILIISQKSPWHHIFFFLFFLFYKQCSEFCHSFHFNFKKGKKKVRAAMSQVDPELYYYWRPLLCLG